MEREGLGASRGTEERAGIYQIALQTKHEPTFGTAPISRICCTAWVPWKVLRTDDWITLALRTDGSHDCSGWAVLACRTTMTSNYIRIRNSLANWERGRPGVFHKIQDWNGRRWVRCWTTLRNCRYAWPLYLQPSKPRQGERKTLVKSKWIQLRNCW